MKHHHTAAASPGDNRGPSARRRKACSVLALIGALCAMVVVQSILFPLLLSMVIDPFPHGSRKRPHYDDAGRVIPPHSFPGDEQERHGGGGRYDPRDLVVSQQQQQSPNRVLPDRPKDGEFNGVPIYLMTMTSSSSSSSSSSFSSPSVHSHVHCVGEDHHRNAWRQRSCRFSHFCFNMSAQEFVVFPSRQEQELWSFLYRRPFMYASTSMQRVKSTTTTTQQADEELDGNTTTSTTTEDHNNDNNDNSNVTQTEMLSMSIGGLNGKWGRDGIRRLKWFPKVVLQDNAAPPLTYYALPDWVVLTPFHSLNGANPGHLVWDDFMPIYNLLHMYQLLDRAILPLRYVLNDGERGLWASCDTREAKADACDNMIHKFIPLLLGQGSTIKFTSTVEYEFRPKSPGDTDLICARTGVAGIGALTDHGVRKAHGWEEKDYEIIHNHGRGGFLYEYRNFMMRNMGLDDYRVVPTKGPHRIVFSQKSSDIQIRSLTFDREIQLVTSNVSNARVESYIFKELTLREQLDAVKDASVYITLCGGGAVTAMFLPRGASVFLYYASDGGAANNRLTHKPAMLDWDLFNAMSHLRVHWLPRNSMRTSHDGTTLVLLIQHELDIIQSRAFF